MKMQLTARHQEYWSKNLRITGLLVGPCGSSVTFVLLYFSRDLTFSFFGWPFSFWVAAQGASDRLLLDHLVLRSLHEQP
jgi:putative solute:sodium symporter small subunit